MTEETIIDHGDMYLRFDSEEQATEMLAGYTGSIDIIGTIYKPGPLMTDADGNEFPQAEAIPGWHVNTRGPMLPQLLAYAVTPAAPVRVWA